VLDLPSGEVHVWLVRSSQAEALTNLLDDEERARAARFAFSHSTELFTAAHGALRLVLGRYLDVDPRALVFATTGDGKPYLERPSGGIEFNLAHSGAVGAVALAVDHAVGVDVEERRARTREPQLARRIMTPAEHARYVALHEDARRHYFFDVWARKEALLKTTGEGIRATLTETPSDPGEDGALRVVDFDVPGYAAAVASTRGAWTVAVREVTLLL
jgi:4'-phosphopantetheinyl transferase